MSKDIEKLNRIMLPISIVSNHGDESFSFTEEEFQIIKKEMDHYEDLRAVVIEALKIVQKRYGWITDSAIISIANILGISSSDVESVATFYNQIFREPVGRHIIRFCDSVVCYISGYQNIQEKIEQILSIKLGETTLDSRFTLLPISCLGRCDRSPVIMIDDDIYSYVLSMNIREILEKYL